MSRDAVNWPAWNPEPAPHSAAGWRTHLFPTLVVAGGIGFAVFLLCAAPPKAAVIETYPATGRIVRAGRPVAEVWVRFYRREGRRLVPAQAARTDAGGAFEIGSPDCFGLRPGVYSVCVVGPDAARSEAYRSPLTTPLKATIGDGRNDLPEFELAPQSETR
jgi:hypothetical protein